MVGGSSKKRQRILPQTPLAAAGVGHAPLEFAPEGPAVSADEGVDELVEDDVIGEVGRKDGQARVELDVPPGRGAAPDGSLVPDAQPAERETLLRGERRQTAGKLIPRRPPVEALCGSDGFEAALPGPLDAPERPGDPCAPGEDESPRFLERHAPGDGHPDPARSADRKGNVPGPPAAVETNGSDAVEHDDARLGRGGSARRPGGLSPRSKISAAYPSR
jgi:hypothetical protein